MWWKAGQTPVGSSDYYKQIDANNMILSKVPTRPKKVGFTKTKIRSFPWLVKSLRATSRQGEGERRMFKKKTPSANQLETLEKGGK